MGRESIAGPSPLSLAVGTAMAVPHELTVAATTEILAGLATLTVPDARKTVAAQLEPRVNAVVTGIELGAAGVGVLRAARGARPVLSGWGARDWASRQRNFPVTKGNAIGFAGTADLGGIEDAIIARIRRGSKEVHVGIAHGNRGPSGEFVLSGKRTDDAWAWGSEEMMRDAGTMIQSLSTQHPGVSIRLYDLTEPLQFDQFIGHLRAGSGCVAGTCYSAGFLLDYGSAPRDTLPY